MSKTIIVLISHLFQPSLKLNEERLELQNTGALELDLDLKNLLIENI
jgi:hypothetical protein